MCITHLATRTCEHHDSFHTDSVSQHYFTLLHTSFFATCLQKIITLFPYFYYSSAGSTKIIYIYTLQCEYSILLIRVSKRMLLAGEICVKQPHFKNLRMWPVLSYQYSRTGKFGNDGLHCEPFIIKSCDWTGESQVKTVPIGQKMVISYYQLL